MEAATATERRMSFQEFLELPDELRAEYVDGVALMNPPPSYAHRKICQRLTFLLAQTFGDTADVVGAAGWRTSGSSPRLRIPDIMVLAGPPDGPLVTTPPLVVVEVLLLRETSPRGSVDVPGLATVPLDLLEILG